MEPMKTIAAAALTGMMLATTPTFAADLFGSAPPPVSFADSSTSRTEVGTNWYIRGDLGISVDNSPSLSIGGIAPTVIFNGTINQNDQQSGNASTPISVPFGPNATSRNPTVDLGVGYRINDYLRVEGTWDYRRGPGGSTGTTVVCPYSNQVVYTTVGGVQQDLGYVYNATNQCNGVLNVTQSNNMGLASAFVDLGTWWGITPYVGAGAGMNVTTTSGTLRYYIDSSGAPYNVTLTQQNGYPNVWYQQNPDGTVSLMTKQPNVAIAAQNWDRQIQSTKYTPAWALSFGLGIAISPSATLDINYRYLNTGTVTTLTNAATNTYSKQTNSSQQLRVGVRYMVN